MLSVIATLAELSLLAVAAIIIFQRYGYPLAAAGVAGIVTLLLTLSFIFQATFLLGRPSLSFIVEIVLIGLAVRTIIVSRDQLREIGRKLRRFIFDHPTGSGLLLLAYSYLGLQVLLLPPDNWDGMTYNLARVLLFQQAQSPFLEQVTTYRQAVFPVGSDILAYLWLRLGLDYGVGLFSLLAYLAIGSGVYALARFYVPSQPALTAAVVISSLPEIVYQATSIKNDILAAAVVIFCFLLAHRLLARPQASDLCLLGLGLCFGIAVKLNFVFFALPFALIFGILLWLRHGLRLLGNMLIIRWPILAMATLPAIVLSQLWLFGYNYLFWGGWFGLPAFTGLHRHQDGLWGAMVNLVRYLLESVHLLVPIDILFQRITGYWFAGGLQRVYDVGLAPLFGQAGTPHTFAIRWLPHEDFSWFGPLGVGLVLPAIGYALWRGPTSLRAVAAILLAYIGLLAWLVAWMPWNNRFFTMFFAPAGVCVAYLLARLSLNTRRLIQLVAGLILLYAAFFNQAKPLFLRWWPADQWAYHLEWTSIWTSSDWGRNRAYFIDRHYGDQRVAEFSVLIPPQARVGLTVTDETWIYPYLLQRSDLNFIPLDYAYVGAPEQTLQDKLSRLDYILCLDQACELDFAGLEMVHAWQSEENVADRRGALFRVLAKDRAD